MKSLMSLFDAMGWVQVQRAEELTEQSYLVKNSGLLRKNICSLRDDSRGVTAGDVFIAVSGHKENGAAYIEQALQKGAAVIITDRSVDVFEQSILVNNTMAFRSLAAQCWYEYPARELHLHGITGTNGKTTCAMLLQKVLQRSGRKCGISGTVYNNTGDGNFESKLTTPGILELQRMLREAADNGCTDFVMEVSSHALQQGRVEGVVFDTAIFTNLTQDHLDFHTDMEEYFCAKTKLFHNHLKKEKGTAVVNSCDEYGQRIISSLENVLGYSSVKGYTGALSVLHWEHRKDGIFVQLDWKGEKLELQTSLWGRFNLENILAVCGASLSAGLPFEVLQYVFNDVSIPGRFETVLKMPALVLVDYAHTPDALRRVLETASDINTGRLITVFGCGGDRDRSKRPIMGSIVQELSDVCVLTSDNPRTEDPRQIINDTLQGMEIQNVKVIEDRKEAIQFACEQLIEGDCLVVAGKGHETYQILGETVIHFDDREVLREMLEKKEWS